MHILGISCVLCRGQLESLRIVDGVVHTRCPQCSTVSEPQISERKTPSSSGTFVKQGRNISKVEVRYKPIIKSEFKRPDNKRINFI